MIFSLLLDRFMLSILHIQLQYSAVIIVINVQNLVIDYYYCMIFEDT